MMPDSPESPAAPAAQVALPTACVVLQSVPGGLPDLDAELRDLIAEAGEGRTLKVRIPFTVLLQGTEGYQYQPLRKVAWILEFSQPAVAKDFREGLDQFLRTWVEATAKGQQVQISVEERGQA